MVATGYGVAEFVSGELGNLWREHRGEIPRFLKSVGVTGEEHSTTILPGPIYIPEHQTAENAIDSLRRQFDPRDEYVYVNVTLDTPSGQKRAIYINPVPHTFKITTDKSVLSFYTPVHSTLIAWWLIFSWRSSQLADATWRLGDKFQIIPAAACARSLMENAAVFLAEAKEIRDKWQSTKSDCIDNGIEIDQPHGMTRVIMKFITSSKFDHKAPEFKKTLGISERTNILTQIEKLSKIYGTQVQEDYQMLCNTVHPSIGGFLAYSGPFSGHHSGALGRQDFAPFPLSLKSGRFGARDAKQDTVESSLIRASVMASAALRLALDEMLAVVDDVALTTFAPKAATYQYWRNIVRQGKNANCPCRSGKRVRDCVHSWTSPAPSISLKAPLGAAFADHPKTGQHHDP